MEFHLSIALAKPVVDLLREFLDNALSGEDDDPEFDVEHIIHHRARMCRKCNAAFERFTCLRKTPEENLNVALDAIVPSSKRIKIAAGSSCPVTASQDSSASGSTQGSPTVSVSLELDC